MTGMTERMRKRATADAAGESAPRYKTPRVSRAPFGGSVNLSDPHRYGRAYTGIDARTGVVCLPKTRMTGEAADGSKLYRTDYKVFMAPGTARDVVKEEGAAGTDALSLDTADKGDGEKKNKNWHFRVRTCELQLGVAHLGGYGANNNNTPHSYAHSLVFHPRPDVTPLDAASCDKMFGSQLAFVRWLWDACVTITGNILMGVSMGEVRPGIVAEVKKSFKDLPELHPALFGREGDVDTNKTLYDRVLRALISQRFAALQLYPFVGTTGSFMRKYIDDEIEAVLLAKDAPPAAVVNVVDILLGRNGKTRLIDVDAIFMENPDIFTLRMRHCPFVHEFDRERYDAIKKNIADNNIVVKGLSARESIPYFAFMFTPMSLEFPKKAVRDGESPVVILDHIPHETTEEVLAAVDTPFTVDAGATARINNLQIDVSVNPKKNRLSIMLHLTNMIMLFPGIGGDAFTTKIGYTDSTEEDDDMADDDDYTFAQSGDGAGAAGAYQMDEATA